MTSTGGVGFAGLVVLAVDDDEVTLDELSRFLSVDVRVRQIFLARNAADALQILNSREMQDSVDVVFLDIRMPGLDGLELARVFSSMTIPPSVIFVTAHHDRVIDAYEVGAVDYLLKPIRAERLSASIDRVVVVRDGNSYGGNDSTRDRGRVFLCHSNGDKEQVRELYRLLTRDGHACWFDEEDLLPGQDWDYEITAAIRDSRFVLACLSQQSITKKGYIQKELKKALDVADEQPEGATYLIPVRLEKCTIPQRLRRWQWVDLFNDTGYDRLLLALRSAPAS